MSRAAIALTVPLLATACLQPPTPASRSGAVIPNSSSAPQQASQGGPWPWKGGRAVAVTLNASKVLREVSPRHFGNNTSWWAGKSWTLDPDRINKARQANFKFWRWPGGSSSDEYLWDGNGAKWGNGLEGKDSIHMNESWAASTDDFLELLRQVKGEGIITLNYGIARYGSLEKAVELATSWVQDLNVDKKANIELFEIGNEAFGSWETGHHVPGKPELTGAMYGKDAAVICKAIKAVDPKLKCGATAVVHDNGEEWTGYKWWMRDLLPEIEGSVDFLIVHEYFSWPFEGERFISPSNAAIFANVRKVKEGAESIAAMTRKYTKRTEPFPLALTEFNIINGGVPQTLQLINGLFTAEVLGEALLSGYMATNIWDWRNGYDPKHGGGDHALLASKDPTVPDDTPRPAYYAYAVFARAFGDQLVESTSSDARVKVYASRFKENSNLGLVLVNETEQPVRITVSGADGKTKLLGWVLTGESLNSTRVTFNGVAGPEGGGGPFPIDSLLPYRQDLSGPVELTLPAASLSGVLLTP